jgi:hypothetical protein
MIALPTTRKVALCKYIVAFLYYSQGRREAINIGGGGGGVMF